MQTTMPYPDAFALKNSGLNAFLFAGVGDELNGSPLTILSILARLGEDPWARAAQWSELPKAAAIECLAESIEKMPLVPRALADARATAARLIPLLPARISPSRTSGRMPAGDSRLPAWVPITAFFCSLALGLAIMTLTPKPSAPPHQAGYVASSAH